MITGFAPGPAKQGPALNKKIDKSTSARVAVTRLKFFDGSNPDIFILRRKHRGTGSSLFKLGECFYENPASYNSIIKSASIL